MEFEVNITGDADKLDRLVAKKMANRLNKQIQEQIDLITEENEAEQSRVDALNAALAEGETPHEPNLQDVPTLYPLTTPVEIAEAYKVYLAQVGPVRAHANYRDRFAEERLNKQDIRNKLKTMDADAWAGLEAYIDANQGG